MALSSGILAVELDVRAQDPVGFRVRTHAALLVEHADVLRNHGQHRHLQVALHVLQALHRGIEVLQEERDADAENQADHRTERQIQGHVRTDRHLRQGGFLVHDDRLSRTLVYLVGRSA